MCTDELQSLYTDLMPTPKKVCHILCFPDEMSEAQRETVNHLKRFLREMNCDQIHTFMRFCTGSNLMISPPDKIQVIFTTLEGVQRRPVAHTCGKVLSLPSEYEGYVGFRMEFNNVLSNGVWVMDIV